MCDVVVVRARRVGIGIEVLQIYNLQIYKLQTTNHKYKYVIRVFQLDLIKIVKIAKSYM